MVLYGGGQLVSAAPGTDSTKLYKPPYLRRREAKEVKQQASQSGNNHKSPSHNSQSTSKKRRQEKTPSQKPRRNLTGTPIPGEAGSPSGSPTSTALPRRPLNFHQPTATLLAPRPLRPSEIISVSNLEAIAAERSRTLKSAEQRQEPEQPQKSSPEPKPPTPSPSPSDSEFFTARGSSAYSPMSIVFEDDFYTPQGGSPVEPPPSADTLSGLSADEAYHAFEEGQQLDGSEEFGPKPFILSFELNADFWNRIWFGPAFSRGEIEAVLLNFHRINANYNQLLEEFEEEFRPMTFVNDDLLWLSCISCHTASINTLVCNYSQTLSALWQLQYQCAYYNDPHLFGEFTILWRSSVGCLEYLSRSLEGRASPLLNGHFKPDPCYSQNAAVVAYQVNDVSQKIASLLQWILPPVSNNPVQY